MPRFIPLYHSYSMPLREQSSVVIVFFNQRANYPRQVTRVNLPAFFRRGHFFFTIVFTLLTTDRHSSKGIRNVEMETRFLETHFCFQKRKPVSTPTSQQRSSTAYFAGTQNISCRKESYRVYIGTSCLKADIYAY